MTRSVLLLGIIGAAALVGACTGTIGGDGSEGNTDVTSDALCVVDTPIRRLTRFEYNNTVRDLLGDTTEPASVLPPEEEVQGFNNQAAALTVSDLLAEQYMKVAEGISERAVQDLATLVPGCVPATDGNDACALALINDLGKRAFRRPLEQTEIDALKALFDTAVNDPDFATFEFGARFVIEALLQSPHFLYRPEFGSADPIIPSTDIVALDDWEIATKLSYMLWNTMPDEALFDAAETGALSSADQIAAQARRMLDDPRAKDAIRNFHDQWLLLTHMDTISKDTTVFPAYNDGLRPLWKQEVQRFIEYVILEDDATLQTLLTADYSFLNAELAAFYGADVVGSLSGSGTELQKVALDPQRRSGFLTTGALMATHAKGDQSSPVFRGKFVREQLMCQILPLPPNDLVIEPPPLDSTKTTREQFELIGADPDCSGCHSLMNPVGFMFENYDGIGQWRDTQNSKPIDATGEMINSKDLDGDYDGAVDLASKLAQSQQVAQCVTSQWFRFAYNRTVSADDACTVEELDTAFAESGYNIKELLVTLTQTRAFLYRHAVVVEGGQP